MSSFYFEVCKDRLYTTGKDSKHRRSAQTALHASLGAVLAACSPMVPFTAEDIYPVLCGRDWTTCGEESRHEPSEGSSQNKVFDAKTVPGGSLFRVLTWHEAKEALNADYGQSLCTNYGGPWPVLDNFDTLQCIDAELEKAWVPVGALRDDVQRVIEVARKEKKAVGSSLDAAIELIGDWQSHPEARTALEAFGDLSEIFVVSQVDFVQHEEAECFAEEDGIKLKCPLAVMWRSSKGGPAAWEKVPPLLELQRGL